MPDYVEVHLRDVGTKYRVRVMDEGGDFDPSSASVKQLIFLMPGDVVLEKTATVETGTGDEAGQFFLAYTVTADAGAGSPAGDFHDAAGKVTIQAYLEWADGKQYHSNKRTTDDDGNELRVRPNLR
jgi:hypothetical protein